jgi:hypothetical protein
MLELIKEILFSILYPGFAIAFSDFNWLLKIIFMIVLLILIFLPSILSIYYYKNKFSKFHILNIIIAVLYIITGISDFVFLSSNVGASIGFPSLIINPLLLIIWTVLLIKTIKNKTKSL